MESSEDIGESKSGETPAPSSIPGLIESSSVSGIEENPKFPRVPHQSSTIPPTPFPRSIGTAETKSKLYPTLSQPLANSQLQETNDLDNRRNVSEKSDDGAGWMVKEVIRKDSLLDEDDLEAKKTMSKVEIEKRDELTSAAAEQEDVVGLTTTRLPAIDYILVFDPNNCPIDQPKPNFFERLMERFETDHEIDYVSGPFERSKLELFEGHEDKLSFFRSSVRSLLVHRILNSINQSESQKVTKRSSSTVSHSANNKKHGLPYLLMKGAYQDAFVLHDQSIEDPHYLRIKSKDPEQFQLIEDAIGGFFDPRKEMKDTWTKFFKFQPLWKIRNYFGEKIAMYFAWQGVLISFLWVPAFIGLGIFMFGIFDSASDATYSECKCWLANQTVINGTTTMKPTGDCIKKGPADIMATDVLGVVKKAFNNTATPYFSFMMCLWGLLFLTCWKRKNARVAYEWDCNNYEDNEPDRPEFVGTDIVTDPITREYIWVFPASKRVTRYLFSTLVVCSMMMLVFISIAGAVLIKVVLRVHWNCPPEDQGPDDRPVCDPDKDHPFLCIFGGVILPSLLMAVFVLIWGRLYENVAVKLTDYENHQTQSDYQNAYILKLFAFQFVNHYAALFYLAVFRPKVHNTQDEGLFGLGPEYQDTCRSENGKCMSILSFQVLLLMIGKPCFKFIQDIMIPYGLRKLKVFLKFLKLKRAAKKVEEAARAVSDGEGGADWHGGRMEGETEADDNALQSKSYIEREWRKPPPGDFSLEEFTEKTMQFGYVVLFTAAFPLAPFISLIVNAVDMRVDARRLLWFNRRPISYIAADIGMWEPILQFLNVCGVITNGFLVVTTSEWSENQTLEEKLFMFIFFEEKIQVIKILADGFIPRAGSGNHHIGLSRTGSGVASKRAASCTLSIEDHIGQHPFDDSTIRKRTRHSVATIHETSSTTKEEEADDDLKEEKHA